MADVNANIGVNIDTSDALAQLKSLQRQISQFHTSIAKSSETAALAQKSLQKNMLNSINAIGAFSAELRTVKTTAESFTTSLEGNKFSMREYFRYAGASTKTFGKLFKSEYDTIGKVAEDRVKKLQTQYIKMGRDASGAMKAIAITPNQLNMQDYGTKVQLAAQKQALFNQLMKQGSTNLLNFGKNTQWAGRQLMVGFSIPLMAVGSIATKTFNDMEAQAIKFKKVYGDLFTPQAEAQQALADIQELAKGFTQYGIAASATVGLSADAAAAGFKGAGLIAQTTEATRLSVLGQIDSQQALQTTIALQNAFSISSTDLANNIDFLNAVENQTVLSLDDITTAIPKVAPVIMQLGGNVKDLAFFLTAMKEGGVNASEGANALKSGLASLINPTKSASTMLKGFGINIQDIVLKDKGDLKKTVVDFATALNQLDPLNRAQAIEKMFGKFQFARLSTLFQNVTKDGTQASRVLDLASASTAELAGVSSKELGITAESSMMKFKKAVEDLKITLIPVGKAFLEAVTPIVKFVGNILDKFNNLSGGVKKAITIMITVIAGLGPVLLMAFGLLANGVANIIKLFLTLRGGYQKLTNQSQILGDQTQYLNSEQIDAAAAAHSLEQSHARLTQQFTAEASAVAELILAYQAAARAGQSFTLNNPGSMLPPRGAKKFASGGVVPGSGSGDTVPAMLTPGEVVVPKGVAKANMGLLSSLLSGGVARKYAQGTLNVGGQAVQMQFLNDKNMVAVQNIITQILSGATGLKDAEGVIAETLIRLSTDTKVSANKFVKELDIVAGAIEKIQIPEKIVGERDYSASGSGVSQNVPTQLSATRGIAGTEEYRRAQVAAQATQKAYEEMGISGQQLAQSIQVDRAHIVEVTQAEKRYREAWDTRLFVAQARAENEMSMLLTNEKNQKAYVTALQRTDASEEIKASILSKITKDIALSEQELQVQVKVLQAMQADASLMKQTTNQFSRVAIGTIAAGQARAGMGVPAVGVGSRTPAEIAAARRSLSTQTFRGDTEFVKKLQSQGTQAVTEAIVAMEKTAETQSPSKRTRRLGKNIVDGLVLGIKGGTPEAIAASNVLVDGVIPGGRLGSRGASTGVIRPGQSTTVTKLQNGMPVSRTLLNATEEETKKRRSNTESMGRNNAALMGGTFALTSLASVGSMTGGVLGDLSQQVMKYSGLLFGLMTVTQLMTKQQFLALTVGRLQIARGAMASAKELGSSVAGAAGKSGLLGGLARVGLGLKVFLGPIGLATTAATLLYMGFRMYQKKQEEAKQKIEGLGKAANISADQIAKLGQTFGVTPKKGPLETFKPTVVASAQQKSLINEARTAMSGDKGYAKDIEAVKKASTAQAELIFKTRSMKLLSQGFAKDQVQAIIQAMQEDAGKTNVKFDVNSIDISTKDGKAGLEKSANLLLKDFATSFEKGYSKQKLVSGGGRYSVVKEVERMNTDLKTKLSTASNGFSAFFTSLATDFSQGRISIVDFNSSFSTLSSKLTDMSKTDPAAALRLVQETLLVMNPELAKAATGVKSVSDEMLILKAASLGMDGIEKFIIAIKTLENPASNDNAIRQASKDIADFNKRMNEKTKAQAEANKTNDYVPPGGGTEDSVYVKATKQLTAQRKELGYTANSYAKLKAAGVETGRAFEVAQDPILSAAIATTKVGTKEWKSLLALIKTTNAQIKNGELLQLFEKRTSDMALKNAFNGIVPILVSMGLNLDNIKTIMDDPNLAQQFITDLKDGSLNAENLKKYIEQIPEEKRIKVQFDLSTPEGVDQAFNDISSKADQYFSILENGVKLRFAGPIAAAEGAATAASDAVQKIQDRINTLQTDVTNKQRNIELNITRPINDLQASIDTMQRSIETNYTRPINALQVESTKLSEDLTVMDNAAQGINDKYDTQAAALTKISEINQQILDQQRGQLDLAGALSSGDIAAAAKAAQDMRASAASAAVQGTTGALDAARAAELANIKSPSGMTKDQIAQRQYDIERQVFALNQQADLVQAQILVKQDQIYKLEQDRTAALAIIQVAEDNIYTIQNGELINAQALEVQKKKALEDLQAQRDIELKAIDDQKLLWEQAKQAIDEAKIKSGEFDDVITKTKTSVQNIVDNWNNGIKDKSVTLSITEIRTIITNSISGGNSGNSGSSTTDITGSGGAKITAPSAFKMYGGFVKEMAVGGFVPGIGMTDSVPTMLTPGEFVMNKNATTQFGAQLAAMNSSKYPSMMDSITPTTYSNMSSYNVSPTVTSVSTNVNDNSNTMYNYNLKINVNESNASSSDIARAVIGQIKYIDAQRIRGQK